MVGYGDAEPFPLRWGEVIPLYFTTPYLPKSSHVFVLSQPNRRYTDSVAMIPELRTLGKYFPLIENRKIFVVVVIVFPQV